MFIFFVFRQNYKYYQDYIESLLIKCNSSLILIENFTEYDYLDLKKNDKYIFVQGIPPKIIKKQIINQLSNVYLLNTECLFVKENFKRMLVSFVNKNIINGILSYNKENIEILINNNINKDKLFYMPLQVIPEQLYDFKKENNIFTSYRYNKYRENIINKLNFKINQICKFGKKRDNIIYTYKIHLNIPSHLECSANELRLNRAIFNKIIVISLKTHNYNIYELKDYIIYTEIENLEKTCLNVLNNYDEYYNKIYGNFNLQTIDINFSKYFKNFFKYINIYK